MKTRILIMTILALALALAACASPPPAGTDTPGVPTVEMAEITVYFMDESRFAVGTEPYEVGVTRELHPDAFLPRLALEQYFQGPTDEEAAQGLVQVLSGCTGFSNLQIEDGIARVYLTGPCSSSGSTYTIAAPIMKTLKQFDEIEYVKIYDADGGTEQPIGPSDSTPFSLEP